MKNMKFWRTALVAALVLTVMLSVTGGTIAWFTDTVESVNNVISSGNLDIEVLGADGEPIGAESIFDRPELWEPGAVAIAPLTIKNAGDLALNYLMTVSPLNENTVNDTYKLSQVLKVGLVEGTVENRADAIAAVKDSLVPFAGFEVKGSLVPEDAVSAEYVSSKDVTLVVYWEPTAEDNNWNVNNGKTTSDGEALNVILGLNVTATQMMFEDDAFDNTYDEDAGKEIVYVDDTADIQAAYESAEDGATIELKLVGDVNLTEALVWDEDVNIVLDLADHAIQGAGGKLIDMSAGQLILQNGSLKNVQEQATTTNYSIYLSGDAEAKIENVSIETSGTGIYLGENAKITELNANVDSYMNANGECAFDGVSVNGNARIESITGGEYQSYYTGEYIQSWYEDPKHSYSGIVSHPISINSANASIGEISGGIFLGEMDKANNGTPIHVNAGTLEKISGGYFGFTKFGLSNPIKMIYVNSSNGGSIGAISGGTFEKGSFQTGFGCDFESIVASSGCEVVSTDETVEVKTQFSTRVATYTLNVVKVQAK